MRRRHIPGEPPPPTKGELKRQAQDVQTLAGRLIDAPEGVLESLQLPEKLVDAILLARRITAHGGRLRQHQFVGKLMRHIDVEPVRAALEAEAAGPKLEALRFKRAEGWRDRLLADGAAALGDFLAVCPAADPDAVASLVADAATEQQSGKPAGAGRRLFRSVRKLLDGSE